MCPSGVKKHEAGIVAAEWSKAERGQTYTIGKKSTLQVEIYDKSLEITEVSGKTVDVGAMGANSDGEIFERDVWRLEVRFGAEFLKERNVRRPHELMALRESLIVEALYGRRVCVPTGDSLKRRWPLHPIWSEAIRHCGDAAMVPVGRMVTGRRDALVDQAKAQISGALRTLSVLAKGDYDEKFLRLELAAMLTAIPTDPEHGDKVEQAQIRYSEVEEAR